jgi:hypothetical protein
LRQRIGVAGIDALYQIGAELGRHAAIEGHDLGTGIILRVGAPAGAARLDHEDQPPALTSARQAGIAGDLHFLTFRIGTAQAR